MDTHETVMALGEDDITQISGRRLYKSKSSNQIKIKFNFRKVRGEKVKARGLMSTWLSGTVPTLQVKKTRGPVRLARRPSMSSKMQINNDGLDELTVEADD